MLFGNMVLEWSTVIYLRYKNDQSSATSGIIVIIVDDNLYSFVHSGDLYSVWCHNTAILHLIYLISPIILDLPSMY